MAVKLTETERELASVIAKHKGRTSVMVSQLKIHTLGAKRIYREVNGVPPKSGLLPSSTETNFFPIQRLQSSLLMILYEKALKKTITNPSFHEDLEKYNLGELVINNDRLERIKKEVALDKARAFTSSYCAYARITKDQAKIDINRFDFLVRDLYKTSNSKLPKKVIQWAKCRICKAKILRKFDETQTKCPYCEDSLTRSRNLVSAFRERAINRSLPTNSEASEN